MERPLWFAKYTAGPQAQIFYLKMPMDKWSFSPLWPVTDSGRTGSGAGLVQVLPPLTFVSYYKVPSSGVSPLVCFQTFTSSARTICSEHFQPILLAIALPEWICHFWTWLSTFGNSKTHSFVRIVHKRPTMELENGQRETPNRQRSCISRLRRTSIYLQTLFLEQNIWKSKLIGFSKERK